MLIDSTAEKVRTLCASPDELHALWADAGLVVANSTRSEYSCSMKVTEDVRKYAAEQGVTEKEALKAWGVPG